MMKTFSISIRWIIVLTVVAANLVSNKPAITQNEESSQRFVSPPALFFTDLESGPNTGGEENLGVFITIWGEGFGENRDTSTVTIGGREVARYVSWGANNGVRNLDKIVVQPGAATASGQIVVTVNGKPSNPIPFTIRSGNIYFVSTQGDDNNEGNFNKPWATLTYAKNHLTPGDTVYIMDGVSQTTEDNYDAALSIETSGELNRPMALIAYPGSRVTIGSIAKPEFGLRIPNIDVTADYWVFAGITFRAANEAMSLGGSRGSTGWRIVGNDFSSPNTSGCCGCFMAAMANYVKFLGNEVHDIGSPGQTSKLFHAVYFSTDCSHIEVGWNHIHDNNTCRAIQFHSSPLDGDTGFNQFDLVVHDNLIHGDVCDGINFATVDPSKGPVLAYNNMISNVGRGPTPTDGDANYAGIYVAGTTNTGADGMGVVEIFNNTLYDCGKADGVPSDNVDKGNIGRGPGSSQLIMNLRNNLIVAVSGEDYIEPSSTTSLITGTNNLWFGSGNAPSFLQGNIEADPLLVNPTTFDFHLREKSPAIDAGTLVQFTYDYEGILRIQGVSLDIGALEYQSQSSQVGYWSVY